MLLGQGERSVLYNCKAQAAQVVCWNSRLLPVVTYVDCLGTFASFYVRLVDRNNTLEVDSDGVVAVCENFRPVESCLSVWRPIQLHAAPGDKTIILSYYDAAQSPRQQQTVS